MNKTHKPLYRSLYFQVIVAIVIGVLLGHFYPDAGAAMKPLGDGFIKLIKMIIAPIIFCTVVVGIAGMEDMTPSSDAMPVNRNTGAIASWMAWEMTGTFSTGDIVYAACGRWRVV